MKYRILCLILSLSILLSGCGFFGERIKEPVTFYYLCSSYQEDLCCVIASEEREASGHTGDLSYLLALYLMGPSNDEYVSPLPTDISIASQIDAGHILLELPDTAHALSDMEFSLACACLTLTCLEITNAEDVTILSGDRTKTLSHSTLTLYDTTSSPIASEESP